MPTRKGVSGESSKGWSIAALFSRRKKNQSQPVTGQSAGKKVEATAQPAPQINQKETASVRKPSAAVLDRNVSVLEELPVFDWHKKRLVIPKHIDGGIRCQLTDFGTNTVFTGTASSVESDQRLGKPISSRDQARLLPRCLASGSNGCVEACTVDGVPAVAKRSYCLLLDPVSGQVMYPDANGIMREVGVLAGLNKLGGNHPGLSHIVPFLGAGVSKSGEPLIYLGRAEGSLEKQLESGPLPLDKVLDYGRGLFAGLSCLASFSLTHQDIKPANLLIKDGKLLLADFGETTSHKGFASVGIDGKALKPSDRVAGSKELKPFHADFENPQPASDIWAAGLSLLTMMNPDVLLDPKSEFLGRFHDYSHGNKPFKLLTEEEQSQLRANIHQGIDEIVDGYLTREQAAIYEETLKEVLYAVFEPDASKRLTAIQGEMVMRQLHKIWFKGPRVPQSH
ncbi:protein kinase domain-containing protein [Parendozoicomonas haliclonae]|uniref:non-specific serine/threonine protein kinase n=1 Tax=Parendozoicomonas haliclonae TaxID=1960125 RepID=A0A1X7AHL5_9GAMM|nr:protein kinase [Parendozoicomonas haliclonae]SMA43104.1 Serine/threonine-protein kinase PknK [Parendozoicomonas haliclonae]